MPAIRTLLIEMPPMFSDLVVQAIADHIPLEIIGDLDRRRGLQAQRECLAPDLILRGLEAGEDERDVAPQLLEIFPTAKVILFSSDRRHAYLHQMRPVRVLLTDFSPELLVQVITNRDH